MYIFKNLKKRKSFPRDEIKLNKKVIFLIFFDFFFFYNFFFNKIFTDLFFFLKVKKLRLQGNIYALILTFSSSRFFINFLSIKKKKNYLFLSPGLFLKYFNKKKSFKKNKTLKILMAKYIRKMLLLVKIKNLILITKQNPTFLIDFLALLNTQIVHKFFDPISKELFEDKSSTSTRIKFLYFVFLKNINFNNQKKPQMGRIKRKITRKLILRNALVD
jgi:hypothetical protein